MIGVKDGVCGMMCIISVFGRSVPQRLGTVVPRRVFYCKMPCVITRTSTNLQIDSAEEI